MKKDQSDKIASLVQQRIFNSQAQAAFAQNLEGPNSATLKQGQCSLYNNKNLSFRKKNPENRRAVGGQKTNQGTIKKGAMPSKRLLKQDPTEALTQPSFHQSQQKITKTNSQLGIEASKHKLDERRREYEQKQ